MQKKKGNKKKKGGIRSPTNTQHNVYILGNQERKISKIQKPQNQTQRSLKAKNETEER